MNEGLHIVHVAKQVNLAVCAVARQLAARGHRQTLLSLLPSDQYGAEARAAGMEVVDQPSHAAILAALERADIVRLEWWNCPHLGALIREPLPAMRLMTVIHVAGDGYFNPVTKGLVEFSDLVVAGCPYTRDHGLLGAMPAELRERKLACVRATPDFARIEGVTRKRGDDDRFTVGYIGTLDRRKIHPAIIDMSAAARVPEIQFVLRGKGDAGHLHDRIAALGLGDRFDVGGYVHDIAAILARCDVFGYPIAVDPGAEMAVQEAMYAGVVPVVFPRGGLRDLVIDGFTGLVVETPQAYARALEYLHEHPEERARMSDNARSFARQLLGPVHAADQLERLYATMMESPKRARTWEWDVAPQARPATPAERFLDTLGSGPSPFATSMRSKDLDEVIAAEAWIATMQTSAYVVHGHARAAEHDGYLQLWSGLVHEQAGDLERAAAALKLASRAGLRHFRVGFYLARIDERLGHHEEARRLIQNVLDHALNFEPARALLSRVAGRIVHRPRQTPITAVFSYPRSGNTWLRYVIEVLTGRPSIVPRNIVNDRPIAERFPELGIDPTAEPSAMKCHRLDELPEGEHWLIVAVRDYSECIVRHRHDEPETEFGFDEELPRYLEPLRYFHEFTGPKLLLYYEDLIRDRQGTITAVGEFLGIGPEPVQRFLADFDAHFRRSVVGYSPGSHTGGRAAHHHGARVSPEMWTRWRAEIVAEAPELHAAYLTRYD